MTCVKFFIINFDNPCNFLVDVITSNKEMVRVDGGPQKKTTQVKMKFAQTTRIPQAIKTEIINLYATTDSHHL